MKNPAELPASRPNSGAGTEKRPQMMGPMIMAPREKSSRNSEKLSELQM
jgi:hypothetical protein